MILLYIFLAIVGFLFLLVAPLMILLFILIRFKVKTVEAASVRQMLMMQQIFRPDLNKKYED